MDILQVFLLPSAWLALLTLVFLEIVLGIDNIVFLSIVSARLPQEKQPRARTIGLALAMICRIALLFGISLLMQLSHPFYTFRLPWLHGGLTGQSLIIFVGGLFLLYKSVSEIHHKLEGAPDDPQKKKSKAAAQMLSVILQIVALDIVFSLDSVLTAVGMVSFTEFGYGGAMLVMCLAIVIAVLVMMFFATPVSNFVNKHPTVQMLGLSFLILIGVMLLTEAAHMAKLTIFGATVGEIPKGYIYFAIAFSLLVEWLNMKLRKRVPEKEDIVIVEEIEEEIEKK